MPASLSTLAYLMRRRRRRLTLAVPPIVLPRVPAGLAATNGETHVAYTWADDPDGLAESWEIEVRGAPDAGATLLRAVTGLAAPLYNDTAASTTAYEYARVRAVGADGASAWSAFVGGHRLTTAGGGGTLDLDITVDGANDGNWVPATAGFTTTSTDLFVGKSGTNPQHGWLRITNTGASVPVGGATGASLVIHGVAKGTSNNTAVNAVLQLVNAANPAAPTTAAEAEAWPLTTARIDWDVPGTTVWAVGDAIQTPDVGAALLETITTHGWATGESVIITLRDDGSASSSRRDINSGNIGTAALRPRVVVSVTLVGGAGAIDGVAPAPPIGLAAANTAGGPYLSWTANVEGDLTGYRVERSTTSGSGFVELGTATTNEYTDTTAAEGATYYYRVRATDGTNGSAPSSEVSITTASTPTNENSGSLVASMPQPRFNSIAWEIEVASGDTDNADDNGPWELTTAGAASGATTLPVSALPIPLVSGTRIPFVNHAARTVVVAVLSANAALGATSLSVTALSGAVAADATAEISGFQFKKSTDSQWRFAFPLHRTPYTPLGGGAATKRWVGSVLECAAGTTYNLRATIRDADHVDGHQLLTANALTWSESIAPHESLSATLVRYVRADGNDSNAGTVNTSGGAWRTLERAVQYLNTPGRVQDALVWVVGPGPFLRPATKLTGPGGANPPWSILASDVAAVNADGTRSLSGGNAAIVYERYTDGTTYWYDGGGGIPASVARQWQAVALQPLGSPMNYAGGVVPGTVPTRAAYALDVGANNSVTSYSTSATLTGATQRVVRWKKHGTDDATLAPTIATSVQQNGSPTQWAELIHTNPAFSQGAWQDGTATTVYLRLLADANPNSGYVWMSDYTNTDAGVKAGFNLNGKKLRVSGFDFRALANGIRVENGCQGDGSGPTVVIDRNVTRDCGVGVMPYAGTGAQSLAQVDGILIEYNRLVDSNLWDHTNTTRLDLTPWRFIKQEFAVANAGWRGNGLYAGKAKIGGPHAESDGVKIHQTGRNIIVRHNTIDGTFNGVGSGPFGTFIESQANVDVYGNLMLNIADDCVEPAGAASNWVVWGNTYQNVRSIYSTDFEHGPLYVIRDAGWRVGAHGIADDGHPTSPSTAGDGQIWKVGVQAQAGYGPRIWVAHDVWWTDITTHGLADNVDVGGAELWYLRNSILRASSRYIVRFTAPPTLWDEDYNLFAGDIAAGTANAGLRIDRGPSGGNDQTYNAGTLTGTGSLAAYRSANAAQFPAAIGHGEHTNRLGGSDYTFVNSGTSPGLGTLDALLADPLTGDLTLDALASPSGVNAGMPVFNVSDLPGVNYLGNAPDIGFAEKG